LPDLWPKHVHVVLTTDSDDQLSMRLLHSHVHRILARQKLDPDFAEACFFQVPPLDDVEQLDMFEQLLERSQRQLTPSQREVKYRLLFQAGNQSYYLRLSYCLYYTVSRKKVTS